MTSTRRAPKVSPRRGNLASEKNDPILADAGGGAVLGLGGIAALLLLRKRGRR